MVEWICAFDVDGGDRVGEGKQLGDEIIERLRHPGRIADEEASSSDAMHEWHAAGEANQPSGPDGEEDVDERLRGEKRRTNHVGQKGRKM